MWWYVPIDDCIKPIEISMKNVFINSDLLYLFGISICSQIHISVESSVFILFGDGGALDIKKKKNFKKLK